MKKEILLLVFGILILMILGKSIALEEGEQISLNEGKNEVVFSNLTDLVSVKSLVMKNQDIQAVSFIDEFGESIGYVNIFNGLGMNFYLEEDKNYEIIVARDVNITLP